MAFYSGVVPPVKTQIQGSQNIPFAQTSTTGRQIVESASGALALQTTAADMNSKLNKLEIMDQRLSQLVINSDTIENYVVQISDKTTTTNNLLITANTFNNASAVNSGVISANTGTTATNTGTTATNTATTNTTLATTNTTLTTANNLATLSNWLAQRSTSVFSPAIAILTYAAFTVVFGPYDTYSATPIAPFTSVPYYNSIYVAGTITAGNITIPTLIFQFSNDGVSFFSEGINPVYSASSISGNFFSLQRINIPTRYVRISTVSQSITITGRNTITLQHIL